MVYSPLPSSLTSGLKLWLDCHENDLINENRQYASAYINNTIVATPQAVGGYTNWLITLFCNNFHFSNKFLSNFLNHWKFFLFQCIQIKKAIFLKTFWLFVLFFLLNYKCQNRK
jgi:hypothetical protein